MARFPSGVVVLTSALPDGTPLGMTCSSLCSVSLSPPLLLVCIRSGSPTLEAIRARGAFAAHLLQEDAQSVSELFSSGAPDRFDRVRWTPEAATGVPHLLDGAHAVADCEVRQCDTMGDHVVVFAGVRQIRIGPEAPRPLVYGLQQYTGLPLRRGVPSP
ncbi:flavin reductase family protein [Streptomyces tubbatahanensis]|uniref:Flavin reductase family protein n=1 Tax=Streptomyces tubbatahanensis TaxID=2923272 RepID=A0ABY3XKV9_9ACTN|nr:flavin reductase family protein [Streptomyces tubbatahanensis]UNS95056.1 flavin reductase family protein [Streptomyces tubbatahanensis]